jgi:glycosyltransferase involved in cell wall biosynthesis
MSAGPGTNVQVSVVTLTHNKLACTRRCIPSLLETACATWELIIVDNGSTDGTPAWVEEFVETPGPLACR